MALPPGSSKSSTALALARGSRALRCPGTSMAVGASGLEGERVARRRGPHGLARCVSATVTSTPSEPPDACTSRTRWALGDPHVPRLRRGRRGPRPRRPAAGATQPSTRSEARPQRSRLMRYRPAAGSPGKSWSAIACTAPLKPAIARPPALRVEDRRALRPRKVQPLTTHAGPVAPGDAGGGRRGRGRRRGGSLLSSARAWGAPPQPPGDERRRDQRGSHRNHRALVLRALPSCLQRRLACLPALPM